MPKRKGKSQSEIYQEVTDRIIAELEEGRIPWRRPSAIKAGLKYRNLVTKTPYHGINPLLLNLTSLSRGYTSPWWLTYNQAKAHGGHVKKDERGTIIVFFRMLPLDKNGKSIPPKDTKTKVDKVIPLLKYWNVFNLEQCEGIEAPELEVDDLTEGEKVERAQAIIENYEDHPEYVDAEEAYYSPSDDTLGLPDPHKCGSPESYFSHVYPELIHSTGHGERLCRFDLDDYGSAYDKEALTGELGSAMLAGVAGITVPESAANAKEAIQGWLLALSDNNRLIVQAASKARAAVNYIVPEEEE
jgi:antirestriction protein ArdC